MPVPVLKIATFMAKYGHELFLGKPPTHQRRRRDDMQSSRLYTLKRIWVFLSSFSMAGCVYLFIQLMTVSAEYNKLSIEKKKWQATEPTVVRDCPDELMSAEPPASGVLTVQTPARAPAAPPTDPLKPPSKTNHLPPATIQRPYEERRHRELVERLRGLEGH